MRSIASISNSTWPASTSAAERGSVIGNSGRTTRPARATQPLHAVHERAHRGTVSSPAGALSLTPARSKHPSSGWGEAPLDLDLSVLRLAVAVGCLIGADNQTAAAQLLSCIPDLDSGERRGQVARWLHDLYPVPHVEDVEEQEWLGPLQPDRLAEQLIADELSGHPELIPRLFTGLGEARAVRSLTVLARAAQNQDRAIGLTSRVLAADFAHLAVPALAVAVETNPHVGEQLAVLLESGQWPVEVLDQIADALPARSVALARVAAATYHQLAFAAPPDSEARGQNLGELSNRLSELGRREEALAAVEEAVAAYR